jgi:hypothetical protein
MILQNEVSVIAGNRGISRELEGSKKEGKLSAPGVLVDVVLEPQHITPEISILLIRTGARNPIAGITAVHQNKVPRRPRVVGIRVYHWIGANLLVEVASDCDVTRSMYATSQERGCKAHRREAQHQQGG